MAQGHMDQIRIARTGRKVINSGTEYEVTFPDGSTDIIRHPIRGKYKHMTPEESDRRAMQEAIAIWDNICEIRDR